MRNFLGKSSRTSTIDTTPRNGSGYDLDVALLEFPQGDRWTVRNACEGTHIFGATGSGKTSGSGEAIAKAFLSEGFGGLVMTAKPDEKCLWKRYCRETGREQDLIVFGPGEDWTFNFLDYEYRRPDTGVGRTENIVHLFNDVLEVLENNQGGREDAFFKRAAQQLLRNAVDLVSLAKDRVTLPDIYEVITSGPQSIEDVDEPDSKWRQTSFCFQCFREAGQRDLTSSQKQDLVMTWNYWSKEFPSLGDRTRSSIVITFTSMADSFLHGTMRQLFCSAGNEIEPEQTHEGKIILLNLPVETFKEVGQTAQVLFKFLWQRATSARRVDDPTIPVFLWADEAQFFVTSNDMMFQSTARSKRACTVYLTQNLSAYYARLGDGTGHAEADALLANFQTHIFHANIDHVTNQWASETISKEIRTQTNLSGGGAGTGNAMSFQNSTMVEYVVMPIKFTTLRRGGPENDLQVEAIILQSGKRWNASGKNYLEHTFHQS